MRFGITPLEAENLGVIFKNGKGLEGLTEFRFSDVIKEVIDIGFEHCEITLDLFQVLPIRVDEEEKERILKLKKEHDITFSAHFPIWSVELSSPNKFVREASVQSYIDSYKIFKFLEPHIEVFVLHPTGSLTADILGFDIEPRYKKVIVSLFTNYAIQSIKKLLKATKIDKKKIAIENIEFPFEYTIKIIEKIRGTKLCLDTAHLLGGFSGDLDLMETFDKYADICSEIHLQDYNDFYSPPDHVALGRGNDFPPKFLKSMNDYDFDGPVVFELGYNQAFESLDYIKKNAPGVNIPKISKNNLKR
ncbi:MAG: TIM barrel protein [Candidatus Lokiarchaeota archaeon]|nr:TIM barrel protein [Candidatus Lokiarchaeota archaeon]